MGAGGGLRVVLDGKDGEPGVPQPLDRPVVQIQVGHRQFRGPGNAGFRALDRKSVVLGGDQHLPGRQLLDGVIAAPVAVRELGGRATEGESDQLVGIADGTSETTFSPDQPVTRGEFAKMLYRALSLIFFAF